MDDFASYSPKKKDDEAWLKEADALLKEYSGRSEGEILKAIYARAVQGKRDGTLTNEQIDAFYDRFSPLLDGIKRKRLKKLVDELKALGP